MFYLPRALALIFFGYGIALLAGVIATPGNQPAQSVVAGLCLGFSSLYLSVPPERS